MFHPVAMLMHYNSPEQCGSHGVRIETDPNQYTWWSISTHCTMCRDLNAGENTQGVSGATFVTHTTTVSIVQQF